MPVFQMSEVLKYCMHMLRFLLVISFFLGFLRTLSDMRSTLKLMLHIDC